MARDHRRRSWSEDGGESDGSFLGDGNDYKIGNVESAKAEEKDEDEESYGPELPMSGKVRQLNHSSGPTIPNLQDLEVRRGRLSAFCFLIIYPANCGVLEMIMEDAESARGNLKLERHAAARKHHDEMKELQEFVAPRAEPGTHERKMEKRRETAAANRAFAESSRRGGSPEAAPDEELMGSGENDLEALKKEQAKEKRRKNEREIRREEIQRARAAEREVQLNKYRAKEEQTIGWLRALAKQRFG